MKKIMNKSPSNNRKMRCILVSTHIPLQLISIWKSTKQTNYYIDTNKQANRERNSGDYKSKTIQNVFLIPLFNLFDIFITFRSDLREISSKC
jgi:hypothetical protein